MTIVHGPPTDERVWDVCVVGAGPVGIAAALECERCGLAVLVLEAGREELHPSEPHIAAQISDPRRHAPVNLATGSAFGGTTWLWGGRCVPFDELDYSKRAHVPDSGWPLGHADVERFYPKAAEYLGCGSAVFRSPTGSWSDLRDIGVGHVERWSSQPKRGLIYLDRFRTSNAVTLSLGSPVVELILGEAGHHVEGVAVAASNGRRIVRARHFILAAGGLGVTRLLLLTQRRWPRHFGGPDGALGRYYMGHLTGQISYIKFNNEADIDYFDYHRDETGHFVQRRLMIGEAMQRAERLLNIAFWPENPFLWDPAHMNGVLSLLYMALAIPPLGRRLVSEPIRLAHVGPGPMRMSEHLRNVLIRPHRTAFDAIGVLWERIVAAAGKPSFIYKSRGGMYALRYHAEQEPDRQNRISLGDKRDERGVPCLQIDYRFSESDACSVVRAHEVVDRALRRRGKGQIVFRGPAEKRAELVLDQATDGYHQIGTTRMGSDRRKSVVNPDCRVHDVENLFVASSSVFPTSGQANPTLLATALAIRIADHIGISARSVSRNAQPGSSLQAITADDGEAIAARRH